MKKILFRIGIVLACLAVLLAVAVFAGLVYINSGHFSSLAQRRIDAAVPGSVTWDSLSLRPFSGRFEIRNVRILDAQGRELAGLDRLAADVKLSALIHKAVRVDPLIIEKPFAHVAADEQGRIDLLEALVPPGAADAAKAPSEADGVQKSLLPLPPVSVVLKLTGGDFSFKRPDQGLLAAAGPLDLNLSADAADLSGNLLLTVSGGRVKTPGIDLPLAGCRVEAGFSEGRVEPLDLRIDACAGYARLTGVVAGVLGLLEPPREGSSPLSSLQLDLSGDGSVDLAALKGCVHTLPAMGGAVSFEYTAKGAPGDPDAALTVNFGGGKVAGFALGKATLAAALKDRRAVVSGLTAHIAGGTVKAAANADLSPVFPAGFLSPPGNMEALSYDAEGTVAGVSLAAVPDAPKGLSGKVGAHFSMEGKGISPKTLSANGTFDADAAGLFAPGLKEAVSGRVTGAFGLEKGVGSLSGLSLDAGPVTLAADAQFNLASLDISGAFDLAVASLAGVSGAAGTLTARGTVSGNAKQPVVSAEVTGRGLAFQKYRAGDVDLVAALDATGLAEVSRFTLKNGESAISASGTARVFSKGFAPLDDPSFDIALDIENVLVTDFMDAAPARGTVRGRVRANGSRKHPAAEVSITAKDASVPGFTLGDLIADLRVADGAASIERITLRNRRSSVTVSGQAAVLDPGTGEPLEDPALDLSVEAPAVYLEDFIAAADGVVAVSGKIRGTAKQPEGSFSVKADDVAAYGQSVRAVEVSARFEKTEVFVDPILVALTDQDRIQGTASANLDQGPSFSAHLYSEGVDLSAIAALREAEMVSGRAGFDITASGTPAAPEATGSVFLEKLAFEDQPLEDVHLDLSLKNRKAKVTGRALGDVTAALDLDSRDFSADVSMERLDLAPFLRIAGLADLSGLVTGRVAATGNAAAPKDASARLSMETLSLDFKQQPLVRTKPFEAAFDAGRFDLPGLEVSLLETGRVRVAASGALGGALDASVDAEIPVAAAAPFAQDVEDLSGTVFVNASATGPLTLPEVQGEVRLDGIGCTLPVLYQKLKNLSGKIAFSPSRVDFTDFGGNLDTGSFSVTGGATLDHFQPVAVDVAFNAASLPIHVPDTLNMLLNVDTALKGTPDASSLRGEVVLLEGLYYKDVKLNLLGDKKPPPPPKPAVKKDAPPFLKNMELAVNIKRRHPFIVDNNVAWLDLNPDLRVTGTPVNLVIQGRATIESGNVHYQNKTFEVKRGVIDFLNPYRIEPTIDLSGEVAIRTWVITLAVEGTPEALQFNLSSDPAEEDGDILSLLLIGKTTKELIAGEGGQAGSASDLLSQVVASTIGENVKSATGLDIFEVETGQGGDSADQVKVTMGKNLSRRIAVKYAVESKDGEMVQRAISEYKFLENVLVSGFQDSLGVFGTQVQYRLEFR